MTRKIPFARRTGWLTLTLVLACHASGNRHSASSDDRIDAGGDASIRDGGRDARPPSNPEGAVADGGLDPDLIAPVVDPYWVLGPGVEAVGDPQLDDADLLAVVTSDYATATLPAGSYDVYRFSFEAGSRNGDVTPFLARRLSAQPARFEVLWVGAPLAISAADAGPADAGTLPPTSRDYAPGTERLVLGESQQIFAGFYTQRGARVRWVSDDLLYAASADIDKSFVPLTQARDGGADASPPDAGSPDAGAKPSDGGMMLGDARVADARVGDARASDAASVEPVVLDSGASDAGASPLLLGAFSNPGLKRAYRFSIALTPEGNAPPPVSAITGLASDKPATLDLSGYEVSFREEFDGPLDISNAGPGTRWTAHTPYNGDFGDAKFTDPAAPESPFSVRDGVLSIRAWFDKSAKTWRSGLLCSVDPKGDGFYQKYGYFEMRAKFPQGPGTWPAFWALTRDSLVNRGKVDGFEADVVEQYGREPSVLHNVWHSWPVKGEHVGYGNGWTVEDMSADFHTYGFAWDEQEMAWYFDRKLLWKAVTPEIAKRELYLLVNLAMGAGWPIDKTPDPSVMQIDYVRAFRKK